MARSATDIIQDIINAAVIDAVGALKVGSKGLPNVLLRDLNAIHANTAIGDLPPAVQTAITGAVRDAFAKLKKEGYVVAEAKSIQPAAVRHQADPLSTPAIGDRHRSPPRSGSARPRPTRR